MSSHSLTVDYGKLFMDDYYNDILKFDFTSRYSTTATVVRTLEKNNQTSIAIGHDEIIGVMNEFHTQFDKFHNKKFSVRKVKFSTQYLIIITCRGSVGVDQSFFHCIQLVRSRTDGSEFIIFDLMSIADVSKTQEKSAGVVDASSKHKIIHQMDDDTAAKKSKTVVVKPTTFAPGSSGATWRPTDSAAAATAYSAASDTAAAAAAARISALSRPTGRLVPLPLNAPASSASVFAQTNSINRLQVLPNIAQDSLPAASSQQKMDNLATKLYDQLSSEIDKYFKIRRQSAVLFQCKVDIAQKTLQLLRSFNDFADVKVYMAGSSISSFASDKADLNLVIILPYDVLMPRRCLTNVRNLLLNCEAHLDFSEFHLSHTVDTLLMWRDTASGIMCSMSVNHKNYVVASVLLKAYANADTRVAQLVLTVRQWAETTLLAGRVKFLNVLDKYSITLMVISFLQVEGVVPAIQQHYVDRFMNKTNLDVLFNAQFPLVKVDISKKSTGELLSDFFRYFRDFNFISTSPSVRLGFPKLRASQPGNVASELEIEDPISLMNTFKPSVSIDAREAIRVAFTVTVRSLETECSLSAIL